jgi:hypothetical protein
MKVQEFIDYMKKNTNRTMKEDQIAALVKRALEVKSYLGIKRKKELIDKIVNSSIIYDSGVFKFDNIQKYICFTMYVLEAYTNLELSEDIEDDFDALSESKMMPILVCIIQQEYDDLNLLLEMQCDYILADNTIEAQVGKLIDALIYQVGKFSDGLEAYVKNFDISKLVQNKDQLMELLTQFNK